jgi:hypothetical protein
VPDPSNVRRFLEAELLRQQQARSPEEVLRVFRGAKPHEIRAAFLAACKDFHPNRFASVGDDLTRLANEVFLGFKRAATRLGGHGRPIATPAPAATFRPPDRPLPGPPALLPRGTPTGRSERDPSRTVVFQDALILCAQRRWKDAQAAFQALAILGPDQLVHRVYLHYTTARVRWLEGALGAARTHLHTSLALDPAFAPAQRALAALQSSDHNPGSFGD